MDGAIAIVRVDSIGAVSTLLLVGLLVDSQLVPVASILVKLEVVLDLSIRASGNSTNLLSELESLSSNMVQEGLGILKLVIQELWNESGGSSSDKC